MDKSKLVTWKRKSVSQELPQEPVSQVSQISQVSRVFQTSQVSQVSQVFQVFQEGFKRSFEKIINQNQKIFQKLNVLLSLQKTLEEHMIKLEQVPDNNNEELVKVININKKWLK